jgi:hypothetical protein
LKPRSHPDQDVEPEVIADRHFVGQPAEIPLEVGQLTRKFRLPSA